MDWLGKPSSLNTQMRTLLRLYKKLFYLQITENGLSAGILSRIIRRFLLK